ncbi:MULTISPECIES: hypothetical protein [Bradyrhizobium]|nr:hypothetical protein [Bradyrhizobium centrosematis]MCS3765872.1 hypothetical protein [Bradyrhizobium centrosematis]MCS3778226.1 hypothetical protein [Bradyrhizobium centrosematis]
MQMAVRGAAQTRGILQDFRRGREAQAAEHDMSLLKPEIGKPQVTK